MMGGHPFIALALTGLTAWCLGAFWPVAVEAYRRREES